MKIAIIGWGSLIWSERILKVEEGEWRTDGPFLPIEFSRISTDNRLTLVIDPDFEEIQTYWKYSTLTDLDEAAENLRIREDTPLIEDVGYVNIPTGEYRMRDPNLFLRKKMIEWGNTMGIDALLWTELEPKFTEKTGKEFNLENIQAFINGLNKQEWLRAEEYIRRAPAQTQTQWRTGIYNLFSSSQ